MQNKNFKLNNVFLPSGDQPKAIASLLDGLQKGMMKQTLLGATGTGKTFTMANVIAQYNKPTLVIAHNKTLAAQLAQELRGFFPNSAVHYFVSYYDYYQPEAYMPVTDTYIEKDAQINKEIDRLRHASTQALLTRKDVIIVASVSCIYGLGSPLEYEKTNIKLSTKMKIDRIALMKRLIAIHFERTNADLTPGTFRSVGSKVEFMPVSENFSYQIEINGGEIQKILKIDPVSSIVLKEEDDIFVFPAKHFITEESKKKKAINAIKKELKEQLKKFQKEGKLLETERLKRRTNYDLAMIKEVGYCSGIENYSRHLSGKEEGEPPETLLSYFPHIEKGAHSLPNFLTIIDESHVTLPQLQGMYAGDASRKNTLVEYGFRLPSAKDNRPLKYEEFQERIGPVIYTSATPGEQERKESEQVVEQIIRPTGLVDPEVIVRPISEDVEIIKREDEIEQSTKDKIEKKKNIRSKESKNEGKTKNKGSKENIESAESEIEGKENNGNRKTSNKGQIQDFINEAEKTVKKGFRVIATTLTKKMAEDLSAYLKERKIKAEYLHSEIKTIERIQILTKFRKGDFDILVGVNLLREGLDLPEVALIGILDADKEGFLRSETALIQTIGRAARNSEGKVILYADTITGSMERAIKETNRRRDIQLAYNKKHKITPKTIIKNIKDITEELESNHDKAVTAELSLDVGLFKKIYKKEIGKNGKTESEDIKKSFLSDEERDYLVHKKIIKMKEKEMNKAVKELDFETASILRDEIIALKKKFKKN